MALTISPMAESDLAVFEAIERAAFEDHPRIPMMWPKGDTPDRRAYNLSRKAASFRDPDCRFMQGVNPAGTIVAVSQWTFALNPVAEAEKPLSDPQEPPPADWPVGGNWRMSLFFKVEWQTYLRQTFAGKPYIVLDFLLVDPHVQGTGAGTTLLSWGVEQADKLGVPMCLESTPAGLKLYKRFGFKEVRLLRADMKVFGWTEPYDEDAAMRVWMIREPQSASCGR